MLHGILEEHQVHHGVGVIVLSKSFLESISHSIKTWELIVGLVIKSSNELGEDKWLWGWAEILLQVELCETLSADFESSSLVSSQVGSIDKSITIDSLGLMDPEFDKVVWLFDSVWLSVKQSLEHVGQMTHIELIMEVLSGLSEVSLDLRVKGKSSLDDWANLT